MKFCILTKPGRDLGIKRGVERLVKTLGCGLVKTPKGADFCIIIGGDGSVLYEQSGIECPILGIRTPGHVGHYLKAGQGNFKGKIRMLVKGRGCFIHKLPRLEALVNGRKIRALALNEALISPIYSRRMLETGVSLGGRKSLERNSGIVVHTPSGASGFARSLGGRKGFGLAPIAPFSGRIRRALALGKSVSVKILSREAELCLDGQEGQVWRLKRGDRILVRKAKKPARIVSFSRKF